MKSYLFFALFGIIGLFSGWAMLQPVLAAQKPEASSPVAMSACAKACMECQMQCDKCYTHCFTLVTQGKPEHATAAQLCLDCADCCKLACTLSCRNSALCANMAECCAKCCDQCADACEKMPEDTTMVACAKACRECTKACRAMKANAGS